MSKENKSVNLFEYLVSKDGKTKYLKLNSNPKADNETKALVDRVKKALGTDILFVNLFDAEFKEKYNIPDFKKGSIQLKLGEASETKSAADEKEVDF